MITNKATADRTPANPASTDISTDSAASPGLARLSQLEKDIEKGLSSAADALRQVQRAAHEIKEDSLWEEAGFASYEAYAKDVWGWEKSQSYAIAKAGETVTALLISGVPENEIPQATSTLNELAKAGDGPQVAVTLENSRQADGSVTVASVRRTLKHTPSIELMIALWSQYGTVDRPAIASHPERMIVDSELFAVPREFNTVKESQQYWQGNAQRLGAIAVERKIRPDAEAQRGLCNVPCRITSTGRQECIDQDAVIMGGWHVDQKDSSGNKPKPWEYQIMWPGSPIMISFHLFQLQIIWEGTHDWKPQAYQPAHAAPAAVPKADIYQPQQVSPLYAADDVRGQEKTAIAMGLECLAPFPTGQYSLIVADPPWRYSLRETDASHRGRTPYPTMEDGELLELPIAKIAADNAYLLLWATNTHLPLAFDCLAVWGFDYKVIHTWAKMSNNTGNPQIGVGHYGRGCTEHFLVATKGTPGSFTSHGLTSIPTVLMASKQEHSRKPEAFWETADALRSKLDGPAIELFARQNRPGWKTWGLESKK